MLSVAVKVNSICRPWRDSACMTRLPSAEALGLDVLSPGGTGVMAVQVAYDMAMLRQLSRARCYLWFFEVVVIPILPQGCPVCFVTTCSSISTITELIHIQALFCGRAVHSQHHVSESVRTGWLNGKAVGSAFFQYEFVCSAVLLVNPKRTVSSGAANMFT